MNPLPLILLFLCALNLMAQPALPSTNSLPRHRAALLTPKAAAAQPVAVLAVPAPVAWETNTLTFGWGFTNINFILLEKSCDLTNWQEAARLLCDTTNATVTVTNRVSSPVYFRAGIFSVEPANNNQAIP